MGRNKKGSGRAVRRAQATKPIYSVVATIFINTDVYKNKNKNIKVAMIDPFFLRILTIGDLYISHKHYRHEACHIEQVKREGRFKFICKYLWFNIKYGYRNNPYEIEARGAE